MSKLLTTAVRNSTWTGISSLGNAVLGFLFAGVTIRWLGPAGAGFVAAVTAIAGINAGLSELGLGTAATRLIARAYEEKDIPTIIRVGGVCSLVSLIFGLIGLGILALGAPVIVHWAQYGGDFRAAVAYCALAGFVFLFAQLSALFTALLSSAQRFDWTTKLNLGLNFAQQICGITLLKLYPSVLTVGITFFSFALMGAILRSIAVSRVFKVFPWPKWHRATFSELWQFGKWVYLANITGKMGDGLDKAVLVSLFGSEGLPPYSYAQTIYLRVHMTLVNQATYLFPMLSAQGNSLEIVAERTEERVRWFIGLISSLLFSGLIIAGPLLLNFVVNAAFAAKAGFQLLVFCIVGFIHAQSIVPYFYNLSKGDAKGNSIYQLITGFGILPTLYGCARIFGMQYAVLGQLMIVSGVLYIGSRSRPEKSGGDLLRWFLKPLYSSIALICIASTIHFVMLWIHAPVKAQAGVLALFYAVVALTIARIEQHLFDGHRRVETLGRGLSIVMRKFGLSTRAIFPILAIPQESGEVRGDA